MAREERPQRRSPAELAATERARARDRLRLVEPAPTTTYESAYQKLVATFSEERTTLLDLMANAERRMPYRELRAIKDKWNQWHKKPRGFRQRVEAYCQELWRTSQILIKPRTYFDEKIYCDDRWTGFVSLYNRGRKAATKKGKALRAKANHVSYEIHVKEARKLLEASEAHRLSNRESKRRAHEGELELRLRRLRWVFEAEATLRGERLRSCPDGSDKPWTQKELDDIRSKVAKIKTLFGRSWTRNWISFERTGQPFQEVRSSGQRW